MEEEGEVPDTGGGRTVCPTWPVLLTPMPHPTPGLNCHNSQPGPSHPRGSPRWSSEGCGAGGGSRMLFFPFHSRESLILPGSCRVPWHWPEVLAHVNAEPHPCAPT